MVIPEGYKNTEIGIIPEDWDVVTFENTFSVLRNNTLSRAELNYYNGDIQNIHYGDVLIKYPVILDCSNEKIPYINNDRTLTTSISFLQDGDIIITDTAEDEMVGKATEIVGVNGKNVVSGLHTIPCRAKNVNTFALKWLGYYINSRIFHDQIIPYITGIKVSSISKSSLFKTTVAYPEKSEQERIVTALSDIDILIDSLEKLIEKKKNIKQGAMQELLTGKRRLPGFDGEWTWKTLQNISCMFAGGTPDSKNHLYYGGDIPWVSIADISLSGKYLSETERCLSNLGLENSSARLFPENTLLLAMYASIGKCCIAKKQVSSSQAILGLYSFQEANLDYVYYCLCLIHNKLVTIQNNKKLYTCTKEILKYRIAGMQMKKVQIGHTLCSPEALKTPLKNQGRQNVQPSIGCGIAKFR